jgi:RNA polymerase sigma factor (sigma-70 family)
VADTIESAENIFSRTIATAQLSSALENIPKDQREVIILKFINEFSYEEIASLFKKKEPAIRKIASRGLENLKKYFAKKNINIYE